ncbi:hypothetical protein J2S43_002826 [Catenuloplanes nepalensis]|uniref:Uncharacterized protein n=1 Tax=Catenuloplanes nepalensis TaxID=587533 RepID=A0ABT9MSG6_9ACTN|nr:hypothetical protein [Catenuloplanes nepalensis]MDP9794314.1 hypothetical protein [Catenuloplanes nepalensis]
MRLQPHLRPPLFPARRRQGLARGDLPVMVSGGTRATGGVDLPEQAIMGAFRF